MKFLTFQNKMKNNENKNIRLQPFQFTDDQPLLHIMSKQSLRLENPPSNSKNIKNIYVKKIHSLLQFSGQNLQVLAKEKKIRKSESTLTQQFKDISKKEKNKESARKARLRKKIYINLLQKTINEMEKWVQTGESLEKESKNYLHQMESESKTINSMSSLENIDQYFFNPRKFSNQEVQQSDKQKGNIDDIFEYGKEINENFFVPFLKNGYNLSQSKQKKDFYNLSKQIMEEQKILDSITAEASQLVKSCSQTLSCKIEHETCLRDDFISKLNLRQMEFAQRSGHDFNIQYAQNLKIKLDNFLNLKVQK